MLTEFYEKHFNPEMPSNSKFRYFKFNLGGKWKIIKARDKEEMIRHARRLRPIEIFYSTSLFSCIDCRKIENTDYQCAHRMFLNNDLVFDLDNENFEDACEDALRLASEFSNHPDVKLEETHQTGSKGIRLIYKDKSKVKGRLPTEREKFVRRQRKALVRDLDIESLDKNITTDTNRVIRLKGSLNRMTLFRCREISLEQLHDPASILRDAMTERHRMFCHQNNIGTKAGPGLTARPSFLKYLFIDNKVKGTKDRYIPFLLYHRTRYRKSLLKKIQRTYNLSTFYIFDTKKFIQCFTLDALPYERIVKIMRMARAQNLKTFLHYKHSWMRTSGVRGESDILLEDRPLYSDYFYNKLFYTPISRPHLHYLKKMGIDVEANNLCGDDKPHICERKEWFQ